MYIYIYIPITLYVSKIIDFPRKTVMLPHTSQTQWHASSFTVQWGVLLCNIHGRDANRFLCCLKRRLFGWLRAAVFVFPPQQLKLRRAKVDLCPNHAQSNIFSRASRAGKLSACNIKYSHIFPWKKRGLSQHGDAPLYAKFKSRKSW